MFYIIFYNYNNVKTHIKRTWNPGSFYMYFNESCAYLMVTEKR